MILNETRAIELKDREFNLFSKLIYEASGINLHSGKRELLRTRVAKILRRRKIPDFRTYYKMVIEDKSGYELMLLIDAISTNVTHFFREKSHFEFLAKTFLNEYVQKKHGSYPLRIRGWSAGCASGEEVYSIIITFYESITNIKKFDIKILGTDISKVALKIAQAGAYDEERLKGMEKRLIDRYFVLSNNIEDRGYMIRQHVKKCAMFRYLNLMQEFPFRHPIDFIFCRNVMIYFDNDVRKRLVRRFWRVLSDGGYLFVGHSESINNIAHGFKYIEPAIYKKCAM